MEYTFHLVLKTTAGTFPSQQIQVRTHTIDNTSGISVCFGDVEPTELRDEAEAALRRMGAKWNALDKIAIDTTHFVCTSPGQGGGAVQYQRALQMSIPTVHPRWVMACEAEKRMVGVARYYLGSREDQNSHDSIQEQAQRRRAELESTASLNGAAGRTTATAAGSPPTEVPPQVTRSHDAAAPSQPEGIAEAPVPAEAPPTFESAMAETRESTGEREEKPVVAPPAAAAGEPEPEPSSSSSTTTAADAADETEQPPSSQIDDVPQNNATPPIPIIKVNGDDEDEDDGSRVEGYNVDEGEQDDVGSLDEVTLDEIKL
jgi:hypothetical protein